MTTPAYDWLDSMIWSASMASVVIGVSALKSKINSGVADDGNNGSFLGGIGISTTPNRIVLIC
ncbi:MAG: hypothetical protein ACP5I7_02175 [Sulfolobales archaeon]